MSFPKAFLITFSILLFMFILLLWYKITLWTMPLSAAQQQTFSFLQHDATLLLNYTVQEISHLEDVHLVMKYADYLFYFLLMVMIAFGSMNYRHKDTFREWLKYGGIITVLLPGIIFILTLFFFNTIFTLFHLLFFPQGNWIFPSHSLLIQTFPEEFFVRISLFIFGLTVLSGILLLGSSFSWKKIPH